MLTGNSKKSLKTVYQDAVNELWLKLQSYIYEKSDVVLEQILAMDDLTIQGKLLVKFLKHIEGVKKDTLFNIPKASIAKILTHSENLNQQEFSALVNILGEIEKREYKYVEPSLDKATTVSSYIQILYSEDSNGIDFINDIFDSTDSLDDRSVALRRNGDTFEFCAKFNDKIYLGFLDQALAEKYMQIISVVNNCAYQYNADYIVVNPAKDHTDTKSWFYDSYAKLSIKLLNLGPNLSAEFFAKNNIQPKELNYKLSDSNNLVKIPIIYYPLSDCSQETLEGVCLYNNKHRDKQPIVVRTVRDIDAILQSNPEQKFQLVFIGHYTNASPYFCDMHNPAAQIAGIVNRNINLEKVYLLGCKTSELVNHADLPSAEKSSKVLLDSKQILKSRFRLYQNIKLGSSYKDTVQSYSLQYKLAEAIEREGVVIKANPNLTYSSQNEFVALPYTDVSVYTANLGVNIKKVVEKRVSRKKQLPKSISVTTIGKSKI